MESACHAYTSMWRNQYWRFSSTRANIQPAINKFPQNLIKRENLKLNTDEISSWLFLSNC